MVRLQLHALAYDMGNFLRTLALWLGNKPPQLSTNRNGFLPLSDRFHRPPAMFPFHPMSFDPSFRPP